MSFPRSAIRRWSSSLVVAGLLCTGVPILALAQTGPGFTLKWDGNNSVKQFGYNLDYGTPGHPQDRYRLKVKSQTLAIDSISISYPDYFDGEFNEKSIALQETPKGKLFGFGKATPIPISSVKLDKDGRLIEIIPETAIPSGKSFEIVLSNVHNPASGGMYNFRCYITSPGDVPLRRLIGEWSMSIFRS